MSKSSKTAPKRLHFTIDGQPLPKQRARTTLRGNKSVTYTPRKTADYENKVGQLALVAMHQSGLDCWQKGIPLSVSIVAYRTGGILADADNIMKAIVDGMEGVVFENDAYILDKHIRVYRNQKQAKAVVTVRELEDVA